MAVIVDLAISSKQFQLGQILSMVEEERIQLETMVPLGNRSVPFFRLSETARKSFEEHVRGHDAVEDIHLVNEHNGEVLFALTWDAIDDTFMRGIQELDGHILGGSGSAESWGFELRFPTHQALSDFQEYCYENDVPIDVKRIFNPTRPDAGPWYGLTQPQRSMLIKAVENGYYALPRGTTTEELAEAFGISDQAVTERLRRGISNLVMNTLLMTAEADD
ncbi:MAG: helix-turn-helix domain-containing protein [Halobacteriales archaeon]|nr:helix-turn-helix domain-containing protein [Halobacteriales archaeon]